jgi:hypothetical protein
MRRSAYRRGAAPTGGNRRLLAVGAVVAALGAAVAFTTISSAAENDRPAGSGAGKVVNGQTILTDTCIDSKLPPADGFQKGNVCVSTEFGEVASAANDASLLITSAPRQVAVNTPFTLRVSTRNLIRDRFLAAGAGGYYVESSVLRNGIVRGHFHTACRMLPNTREAPDPSPVPAFFVATEDTKGGRAPDTVVIQVPGMPTAGTAQCASWAGDGSHRAPMMERANQTPPVDAVRITVRAATGGGAQQGNGGAQQGNGGANNAGGQQGNGATNNGGNGGNNGASTAPTTAPTSAPTTAPATSATKQSTKTVIVPKSTTTTTSAPKATAKAESETDAGIDAALADSTESDDSTKAATPKKSSKAAAGSTDYTYSNEDGQLNSGTKAPAIDQVAAKSAEKKGGVLALTGGNSIAVIGIAVVLMLVGLTVMALTRKRRPGTPWE